MACRSESIAAHAAIVAVFVGGLTSRFKTHNHITMSDVSIVDDLAAGHAAGNGTVDDDGAHQVAHIGRFATGSNHANAQSAHLIDKLLRAVNHGSNHFARNQALVAANGR